MRRIDAIVVGGGVMGTAAARALAERGREVVLLEQFAIGHRRGSSHGPTRLFRLAYPQENYVRLARRALESWRQLEDVAGERLLLELGGLYAGPWGEQCGEALAACGVPRASLPAAEAAERFPGIAFDGLERVLWQANGGVCLADRTIAAFTRLAREGGVEVRERQEVEHLLLGDEGIVVTTASERLTASAVVVAAGTWAGALLSELAVELPLRPAFTQVSYFAGRSDAEPTTLPTYVEGDAGGGGLGSGGYWIPPVEGDERVKVGEGAPGMTVDPSLGPYPADTAREERDAAFVRRRLPSFDPAPLETETCLYTMTPDEDFVLARVGPVVVCSCCSGHGFKFAPLVGELVAELVAGGRPDLPTARFGLDRFAREASELR